jgi:hypothetical protein
LARRIQKSRSLRRSCGRLTVRVNAASCCRSARFSSATARCPRQSSPTNRKSTTSAVSIRDLVVHSTMESSGRTGGQVMANHRSRRVLRAAGILSATVKKTSPIASQFRQQRRERQRFSLDGIMANHSRNLHPAQRRRLAATGHRLGDAPCWPGHPGDP